MSRSSKNKSRSKKRYNRQLRNSIKNSDIKNVNQKTRSVMGAKGWDYL